MAPRDKSAGGTAEAAAAKRALELRIDDHVYNLSAWAATHPGGAKVLEHMHGEDASDAFHSLHSAEAAARLARLPRRLATKEDADASDLDADFRALRQRLEDDGWFNRNPLIEAVIVGLVLGFYATGWAVAGTNPWLATFLLGMGATQAGWAGHDFGHLRGTWSYYLNRLIGGTLNGFSAAWWSDKHNGDHHVYPNDVERDGDVQLEPVFWLTDPDAKDDRSWRRFQHLYYLPVYAVLYLSWRQQSIVFAISHGLHFETALIACNYLFLATLPWKVALGSVLLGGFIVAVVVTTSHTGEDIITPDTRGRYSFAEQQIMTTRDAAISNPLVLYVFGGMNYQLEHHLFPKVPRYRYYELRPLVRELAEKHGLEYREDSWTDILVRNYRTMRRVAKAHSS